MHPFFSSTRASMISCPTTNCRCSSGFKSSSGIACHGVYCSAAPLAGCLTTARFARDFGAERFALASTEVLDFAFSFFPANSSPRSPNCKGTILRKDCNGKTAQEARQRKPRRTQRKPICNPNCTTTEDHPEKDRNPEQSPLPPLAGGITLGGSEADMKRRTRRPETAAVHGAARMEKKNGPVSTPIYQTSTFEVTDNDEQQRVTATDRYYTRWGNPTITVAEQTVAELEGTDAARTFASGMGAITTTVLALLKTGDHIVAQRDIYGGVTKFFSEWLPRLGIETTFVDTTDYDQHARAIRPNTRMLYLE